MVNGGRQDLLPETCTEKEQAIEKGSEIEMSEVNKISVVQRAMELAMSETLAHEVLEHLKRTGYELKPIEAAKPPGPKSEAGKPASKEWRDAKDGDAKDVISIKLSAALKAIRDDPGCRCGDSNGLCAACVCEPALHEQFDRIKELEADVKRLSNDRDEPPVKRRYYAGAKCIPEPGEFRTANGQPQESAGCERKQTDSPVKLANMRSIMRFSLHPTKGFSQDPQEGYWCKFGSALCAAMLDVEAAVAAAREEGKAEQLEREIQVWEQVRIEREELSLENVKLKTELDRVKRATKFYENRTSELKNENAELRADLERTNIELVNCGVHIAELEKLNRALAKQLRELQARVCPEPVGDGNAQLAGAIDKTNRVYTIESTSANENSRLSQAKKQGIDGTHQECNWSTHDEP